MSRYTTNLYNYLQSVAANHCDCTSDPEKLINKYYTSVFDFDFEFFGDSQVKVTWEKSFLRRYLMEEIGLETIHLFKWYLQSRLIERMPEWKMLWSALSTDFEPFDNYNMSRTRYGDENTTGNLDEDTEKNSQGNTTNTNTLTRETTAESDTTDSATSENTRTDNLTQTTNSDGQQLVSDTPQITVQTNDYASSLTRDEAESTQNNTGTVTNEGETSGTSHAESTGTETESDNRNEQRTQDDSEKRKQTTSGSKDFREAEESHGWQGVLPIDVIQKYREGVLSIYKIINDSMQDLFMGVF